METEQLKKVDLDDILNLYKSTEEFIVFLESYLIETDINGEKND